ncbi:unnamed protein product, partial [Phaeothamnion confervicola]
SHAVEDAPQGHIPGTQKVWLKTFGCGHNVSDSEVMAGLLAEQGYRLVEDALSADVWVVNSCTVKDPSQSAFVNLARAEGKPLVVAGCVPQADRKLKDLEGLSIVGVQQIDRVVEAVEQTLQARKENTGSLESDRLPAGIKRTLPSLDLPKIRRDPLVEIVPISTGCLGACTYCKTRHARGRLGSYAPAAVAGRVAAAAAEGAMEIWLSSEDTGAYGLDLGSSISELLREVVEVVPEGVMLRLGMTNPPYILHSLPAIAAALNHPRVFSFLHVPVQSGSDAVLKAM